MLKKLFPSSIRGAVLAPALLLLGLASAADLLSAQPRSARVQKARLELLADRTSYAPGSVVSLAARITVDEGWHIQAHEPALEYLIPTVLELEAPEGFSQARIEYPEPVVWQASFEAEPLLVYDGVAVIVARVDARPELAAGRHLLQATLRYQACDDRVCLQPTSTEASLEITIGDDGVAQNEGLFVPREGDATTTAGAISIGGLGLMLLAGLVGGLILNAMPCVLPVLSLKVFGLMKAAGQGRRQVTIGALASAAGILLSFWALALTAIGVRAAGGLVGWGIQFQNPIFVAFLTVVLVFFCLNMWGLFEITLPSSLSGFLGGVAAESSQGGTIAGHLVSGLFATLMATPCSAPFLGTAVGFALAQSAGFTLAVFTAVGVGMALPYLLLAIAPGLATRLPKPGAWMEHLRSAMGFLLAGTAVWLLYVLSAQIDATRLALVQGALLLVGFFAWVKSRFRAWPVRPGLGAIGMLAAAALTLYLAAGEDPAARTVAASSRIAWVEFDEQRAERIAAEGGLVFVDVTADWCATCKVNERLVLETDRVQELFERHGVVAMKADWTNRDDRIAAYLADFGRYAIPFYVLYRPGGEPHVFGELLTRGGLERVIEESSRLATGAAATAALSEAAGEVRSASPGSP